MVQTVSSKLVSVVVVCSNAKQHLPACLESLHRQNYPDVEVIAVDNGSTDGSREYIETAHQWVRIHATGAHPGYRAPKNPRFHISTGDYTVVLNPHPENPPRFRPGLSNA